MRRTPSDTPIPAMMKENSPSCKRLIAACVEVVSPFPEREAPIMEKRNIKMTTTRVIIKIGSQ